MNNHKSSFILLEANSIKAEKMDGILLFVTLFSILFVPSIRIHSGLFLGIEELLIVIMGLRLCLVRWYLIDRFLLVLMAMASIILISIFANPNYKDYREYLEIHKLAKIGVVYLFTIFFLRTNLRYNSLVKWINFCFLGLVLFNIFHLFNLFYFNEIITILYDTDGRDVLSFGKNSLGGPGPKRIVGTMGNPNINGILFLFFFAFYSFLLIELKNKESNWNLLTHTRLKILFLTSILLVILCQSRTDIGVLVVLYVLGVLWRKATALEVVFEISCTCLFFGLSAFLDTIALQYLFNTKPQIHENNSFAARIKVWVSLIHQWMENPIFGYGPNKAYIYREKLYPENEYVFYLWRYGIQGVLLYLSLLLTPIFSFYKRISHFRFLSMIIIIIASVAFMNNPMSNAKISMLVAFVFGLSLVILENMDTQKNRT